MPKSFKTLFEILRNINQHISIPEEKLSQINTSLQGLSTSAGALTTATLRGHYFNMTTNKISAHHVRLTWLESVSKFLHYFLVPHGKYQLPDVFSSSENPKCDIYDAIIELARTTYVRFCWILYQTSAEGA